MAGGGASVTVMRTDGEGGAVRVANGHARGG
jgi:hypothetical protein